MSVPICIHEPSSPVSTSYFPPPTQTQQKAGTATHLRDDLGQRRALEAEARVPLRAERDLHAALELRLARVRVREVLDEVLCRLLVALLRDDHVRLLVVRARGGVHARDLLDEVRLRGRLLCALAAPRALCAREKDCQRVGGRSGRRGRRTQPGSVVSISLGASSWISRRLASAKSWGKGPVCQRVKDTE